MKKEVRRLSGEVKKILFQNANNGYCVCLLSENEGREVTLTGTIPGLSPGESITALAERQTHPLYGEQWRVTEYEKELPKDEGAILRYLSGRALKGLGPRRAAKIVERFGQDTLSVLEHSPEMLTAIPGISPRLAREVGEAFRAQFGLRQILLFFGGTFGPKTSLAIYQALGSGAVELVRKNPYLLCEKVRGIGFHRADELAKSIGYRPESYPRLSAGLLFVLKEGYQRDGQVYLPEPELLSRARALLEVPGERLPEVLENLLEEGVCIREQARIYLPAAHSLECEAASRLKTLSQIALLKRIPNAEAIIKRTEELEKITYSESQRAAILSAAEHPFSVITGGPGTGKTTVCRALTRLFCDLGMKVCLAAPTGRAAKRLSEKAHVAARTLHRVLEMGYAKEDGAAHFGRNEERTLEESVFLIDEVSMVDLELLVSFLRAVRPGSRVIFIGDADQLPSVGAGNVLADLISSGVFCVTRLDVIYRQGKGSSILRYAHEVREGNPHPLRENEGDLFYLERKDARSTAETVSSLVSVRLPRTYGRESMASTQVLCPARRGAAGTVQMNQLLQSELNPPMPTKREIALHDVIFREGDRVMQVKNDYDLEVVSTDEFGAQNLTQGVFNGDIGSILEIDPTREEMKVRFDGMGDVTYPFSLLDELEHAFAVTVHKSQGSEYDTVILALFGTPPQLCRRALLYTAVTRAKKRLILVGSGRLAQEMASCRRPAERYSTLSLRLKECE